jgi:uncharacterized tellurite resistance protein B-like protein
MSFLDRLGQRPVSSHEAAVTCAVATLTLSGDFTDLERRIISLFRDQFPALSKLQDPVFNQIVERAIDMVHKQGAAQDIRQFVQQYLSPAFTTPQDRIDAYRYAYSLAMANLNVDEGEGALLEEMKSGLGLSDADWQKAEADALAEFAPLHRALAAIVLGLLVVTADGQVYEEELKALKDSRSILEPIARLDDNQFNLVYDLSISVYNRFLQEPDNRLAFLYNIVVPKLDTRDLRVQGFHYTASIATADSDVAQAEVDFLKEVLKALKLNDAAGEAIFNQYMGRVKTIDGKPLA